MSMLRPLMLLLLDFMRRLALYVAKYMTCKIYSKVVSKKASSHLLLIHNLNATAAVRVCVVYWGLVFGFAK